MPLPLDEEPVGMHTTGLKALPLPSGETEERQKHQQRHQPFIGQVAYTSKTKVLERQPPADDRRQTARSTTLVVGGGGEAAVSLPFIGVTDAGLAHQLLGKPALGQGANVQAVTD